jgi:nitroimidazol reductase NimA-like FMN-containing flavoprotein (pyridoxamine 5'-phosphate oxidase superfamily)
MEVDRNGLEVMTRSECLDLLGRGAVGRVGISKAALPAVFPVNYWFDGEVIFIKTGAESALLSVALDDEVVAFEIDEVDQFEHTGWSVLVTGLANAVPIPDESESTAAPIPRWAPGEGDAIVALTPSFVSGRRIVSGSVAAFSDSESR